MASKERVSLANSRHAYVRIIANGMRKLSYCFPASDILKVLQDLKETSLHSVDILKHFVVRMLLLVHYVCFTDSNLC